MRQIHYILITVLLIFPDLTLNAQTENIDIIGKYNRTGSLGFSARIELKPDSSFVYNWSIGLMGGITKGYWHLNNKNLILNSELQPNIHKTDFLLEEMNKTSSQKITIQVKTKSGESLPFATCTGYLNEQIFEGSTDMDGKISFDIESIERIEISFVGFKLVSFMNLDKSINDFVFVLEEESDYYEYFTNEKWRVKKGRLYDYKIKKDRWTKNYFEKVE